MPSINRVEIMGYLGKDVELRYTPNGAAVAQFSVATSRYIKTADGGTKQETEWHNVTAWNKTAENCNQYLQKGSFVYVEGRLQTRSWDGQDGKKHYKTEIVANRVLFLEKGKTETTQSDEVNAEDLPF